MVFTTVLMRRYSPCIGRPSTSRFMDLRQVAVRDRADDARHFGHGIRHLADQAVHRVDTVRPAAAGGVEAGALGDATFAADHFAQASELPGHGVVELDHIVEGRGDLAVDPGQVHGHAHRKVAALQQAQGLEDVAAFQ